ncbi:MAG: phytanoyl-CoA dioxygenase [Chroococcidiopsidaceae cyanobacterium CP_BM_ER_R8_30]|nr:phytanoyl-CoA dioxygenase [Chroococcidiopsidaceae cyanobacterium CP_BM_ER_R8_30]
MLNTIHNAISKVQAELAYRVALKKHAKNLPAIASQDRCIVDSLKSEGVAVTSLKDLGLSSTSQLLAATKDELINMTNDDRYINRHQLHNLPLIYTVTDIPSFSQWAQEERLIKIIENYIGLEVAFQGVHLRKDFNNTEQVGTQLWHKDAEDRRILKIFVYLNDVSEHHGPFEYIPKPITSSFLTYWRIYYSLLRTGFLGINDEEMKRIVPKSAWKSCPGPVGTVILVDTRSVIHHGTLRQTERSALFFVYTAKYPKHPELCTQYSDQTFARPKLGVSL